jgi:hypothetical protein
MGELVRVTIAVDKAPETPGQRSGCARIASASRGPARIGLARRNGLMSGTVRTRPVYARSKKRAEGGDEQRTRLSSTNQHGTIGLAERVRLGRLAPLHWLLVSCCSLDAAGSATALRARLTTSSRLPVEDRTGPRTVARSATRVTRARRTAGRSPRARRTRCELSAGGIRG